jgi:diacylglycerol kinase
MTQLRNFLMPPSIWKKHAESLQNLWETDPAFRKTIYVALGLLIYGLMWVVAPDFAGLVTVAIFVLIFVGLILDFIYDAFNGFR